MAMTPDDVLKLIKDKEVKFVDLRFTDTRGKEQHVTVPVKYFDKDKFEAGHAFDGSSIAGWKGIQASDMLLMPDASSARMDPFTDEPVLNISCDVYEPMDGKPYDRDPRSIAKRAETYLKSTGLGDVSYFGPEPEFFIFDGVTWNVDMSGCSVKIKSEEAPWSSGIDYESGNMGHRAPVKGGYFPVAPIDTLGDIRNAMSLALEQQGVEVEVHHHEVAAAGQCEIGTRFAPLVQRADWMQILKYTVWNVAHSYGKTATFMPKPVVGDNGSGMHVHQSVWKGGKNLFAGNGINLAYSARNRSAACRIPYVSSPNGRRVEVRFPDPTANAYLAFAAMLMAGLDGVQNKIHPGEPIDKDLYHLPPEEAKKVPNVCASLEQALACLQDDHAFLTRGGVFSEDFLESYIALKNEELTRFRMTTHPVEFDMYYAS